MYLSGFTGLKTETILNYQTEGFHLGDVAQAYHLNQDEETLDLSPILNLAKEVGWGAAYQQLGYQPGEHKGLGWLFKEEGKPGNTPDKDKDTNPPDQANNDKDKDTNPPDQANNDKDKDTSPPDHANNDKDKDDKDKDNDNVVYYRDKDKNRIYGTKKLYEGRDVVIYRGYDSKGRKYTITKRK